jgi:prepilin-type N-terminal cleavage/methylation domain-containing protein/prepilin-type processing-associated H-X9-DG protein
MPLCRPYRSNRNSRSRARAFTLTELLVVLAVVALLVCLRLPALASVKTQTYIAQCSGNLRQVTLSFLLYGNENGGRLPSSSQGFWLWDLPSPVYQDVAAYGSSNRSIFFCPSNPYQGEIQLWNYGGNYHVAGYAFTFPGAGTGGGGLIASNVNSTVTPQQILVSGPALQIVLPRASTRVMVADAEICAGPSYNPALPLTNYNFSDIPGGAPPFPDGRHHRASHLAGNVPLGGNLGMLDGHVEWRSISAMIQRNQAQLSPGTPCFLW